MDSKRRSFHFPDSPCRSSAGAGRLFFNMVKANGVITAWSPARWCFVRISGLSRLYPSGEIKPEDIRQHQLECHWAHLWNMPVREGDHVKEGRLLIRLESIQTEADV
jgi:hypothetical protein